MHHVPAYRYNHYFAFILVTITLYITWLTLPVKVTFDPSEGFLFSINTGICLAAGKVFSLKESDPMIFPGEVPINTFPTPEKKNMIGFSSHVFNKHMKWLKASFFEMM